MRIRKATINDLSGIMNVVRNSGYPIPQFQNSEETVRFYLNSMVVIVAEEMSIVGYAAVRKEFMDGAELESIEVSQNFHGKGIADQLLRRAEDIARNLRKNKLYIKCWTGNMRASNFYEKSGYRKKEVLKEHYSDGKDANLWVKEI